MRAVAAAVARRSGCSQGCKVAVSCAALSRACSQAPHSHRCVHCSHSHTLLLLYMYTAMCSYHILLVFALYVHVCIIFTSKVLLLSVCAVCVQESFKTYPPIEEVFLQLRPDDAFAYQSNYGAVSALQCSPFHRYA